LLFGLSVSISGFLAEFFNEPLLKAVIRVQALGLIYGALGGVQKAMLTREMEFRKLVIVEIVSVMVSAGTAVTMAFAGFGVWSLVALTLNRDLATIAQLMITCPWYPQLRFSWSEFRVLWKFGAAVLGNDMELYAFSF